MSHLEPQFLPSLAHCGLVLSRGGRDLVVGMGWFLGGTRVFGRCRWAQRAQAGLGVDFAPCEVLQRWLVEGMQASAVLWGEHLAVSTTTSVVTECRAEGRVLPTHG